MITINEWLELINYKITETSAYDNVYSHSSHLFSSWNGRHDEKGYVTEIVFDTITSTVYQVDVCDYAGRAYRFVHPDYTGINNDTIAWNDVEYVLLEDEKDFMQKCTAILAGEPYDTRVVMPLDLDDDLLFTLMKKAHEKDVTFNQYLTEAITEGLELLKKKVETCPKCDTPMLNASGIGPFCPNKECDVVDGPDLVTKWVDLTNKEMWDLIKLYRDHSLSLVEFYRLITNKLKEKNA